MSARALAALGALLGCRRAPDATPPPDASVAPAVTPATRDPDRLREVLSPAARRALDEATVTLLVPDEPALLATATITVGPQWAAIAIARGDHTLTVHASRDGRREAARREGAVDAGARSDRVRGRPAAVTYADGVRAATWEERGVTYALGLACARADDPRCARDRYLRELANALVALEGLR